jgi:hypothetical protein
MDDLLRRGKGVEGRALAASSCEAFAGNCDAMR